VFHGQWCSPIAGRGQRPRGAALRRRRRRLLRLRSKPVQEGDTAYLKKIWWFDANPEEFKTKNGKKRKYPDPEGYSEIIATPVLYNNRVYVATGQDPEARRGRRPAALHRCDQDRRLSPGRRDLTYDKIHRSISTVAIHDGLLFVGDFSGFVHCLDAETGKVYGCMMRRSHIWGSPLIADGRSSSATRAAPDPSSPRPRRRRSSTPSTWAPRCSPPRCFWQWRCSMSPTQTHLYAGGERGRQMEVARYGFGSSCSWRCTRTAGCGPTSTWSSATCPSALAYHAGFTVLSAITMWAFTRLIWPKHLEQLEHQQPAAGGDGHS